VRARTLASGRKVVQTSRAPASIFAINSGFCAWTMVVEMPAAPASCAATSLVPMPPVPHCESEPSATCITSLTSATMCIGLGGGSPSLGGAKGLLV
jgi:hypothetical protein